MNQVKAVLKNEEGLHARPASVFTMTAQRYKSEIKIYKNDDMDKCYNPKSILSLLSMAAGKGDTITIEAEEQVAKALKKLIESDFANS